MSRRLRIDVVKSNRVIVFPNDFRRNLASDDFLKDGHGSYSGGWIRRISWVCITEILRLVAVSATSNQAAGRELSMLACRGRSKRFLRGAGRTRASTF